MANIPLAEFPNAPAYPVESALIQPPRVNINFADLTAEVDGLMQAQISDEALRTYGRGLNQLAQGISSLEALPDRMAEHFLAEKEKGDSSEVRNKVAKAEADHKASLATTPLTEAVPAFEKRSASLHDDLTAMQLSPSVRRQADELYSRYYASGMTRIGTAGHVAQIEKNKANFLLEVQRSFNNSNYELTRHQLRAMVDGGYLVTEAAEAYFQSLVTENHQRIKQTEISEDPFAVVEDMRTAKTTGHSNLFRWPMHDNEIDHTLGAATTAALDRQYSSIKEITLAQQNRSISEQDIRKRSAAVRLSKEETEGLVHGLNYVEPNGNPEITAYLRENQMSARTKVAAYDPSNDPSQTKLRALVVEINERVATSARPALFDELFKRREGEKPNRLRGEIFSTINRYRENGYFGHWNYERGLENRYSSPDRARAAAVAGEAMDTMNQFFKENPSATADQANARLREIIGQDTRTSAAKAMFARQPFPIYNNPTVLATPLLPNLAEIPLGRDEHDKLMDSVLGSRATSPRTTPKAPTPFAESRPSLGGTQP